MPEPVVWRGPQSEFMRLVNAVEHNCTCDPPTDTNPNPKRCPAHGMLLDQQQLSRLEFEAKEAQRLLHEEFGDENQVA